MFKKILGFLRSILTILLLGILVIVIVQRFSNNKINFKGYYMFTIASESMVPDYKVGDIIISKKVDTNNLNVGDDITYVGEKGELKGLVITHRIVKKEKRDNKEYFTPKGIANQIEDPEIQISNIYGKVIYKTKILSFFSRLMQNIIIYYVMFIGVGVAFSYEFLRTFVLKEKEE